MTSHDSPLPELSALGTDIEQLTIRIAQLAHDLDREPTDRAAVDLYETERALRSAARRLDAARRQLNGLRH